MRAALRWYAWGKAWAPPDTGQVRRFRSKNVEDGKLALVAIVAEQTINMAL